MLDKTEKIREYAKNKSKTREEEVMAIIKKMIKKGDKVTFYSVAKISGASKSYLYKNAAISEQIKSCREAPSAERTGASDKAIISAQRSEIKKLKAKVAELEKSNATTYKEKYEKLYTENQELKKQLENAYTAW